MRRATICFTLILSTLLLGVGTSVMAFTLRLASIGQAQLPVDSPRVPRVDFPTPIFLRLVVKRRTATMALDAAYVRRGFSALRPRLAIVPRPSQSSQQTDKALPRYVSGVETRLLRDTQSVVTKPER